MQLQNISDASAEQIMYHVYNEPWAPQLWRPAGEILYQIHPIIYNRG